MAALTRTTFRLLCQSRTNVHGTVSINSTRTLFRKSLKEPSGDLVKNKAASDMMKDRTIRQEKHGRRSMEAFMQHRMGIKRVLTAEEVKLIGGDPSTLEPDSPMMEEFIDTVIGDMDTYDQGTVEMTEETAKIIGQGTWQDPVLIPCEDNMRFVNCFCPEVDGDAVPMNLHVGERRSCNCGKWFQLVPY